MGACDTGHVLPSPLWVEMGLFSEASCPHAESLRPQLSERAALSPDGVSPSTRNTEDSAVIGWTEKYCHRVFMGKKWW